MKFVKTAAIIAAAVLALSSCGSTVKNDPTVYTIGSQTVTKSELNAYITMYMQNGSYDFNSAKEYAAEDVKNNASMIALAEAMGLEYTDEEKQEMDEQKQNIIDNQGGEKKYKEFLDTLGFTDEQVDNMIKAQFAQEKVFAEDLTEDKLKEYFNNNYFRAKHILLATMDTSTQAKYDDAKIAEQKTLADSLLQRAQSGEDFDALVSEYSEDPGSQSQPDGYYFTYGEMVSEFENTVTGLKENEIGFCESDYGYHVIKRLPLEEGSDAYNSGFESVEQTIKSKMVQNLVASKLPELLKENNLEVTEDEEVYNSITEENR